jgi:multidrug resistance efflux pump
MTKRNAAILCVRWVLFAIAAVLVFGLGWLFWHDAQSTRQERAIDRTQDAQGQLQGNPPTGAAPQ